MKVMFFLFQITLISILYSFPYNGRVINAAGDGIPNANIQILGTMESSTSDENGYFGDSTTSATLKQNSSYKTSKPYIQNNRLYCWLQSPGQSVSIEILSLQGRLIYQKTFNTPKTGGVSFPVNLSGLMSNGIYLVQTHMNGARYTGKFTYSKQVRNVSGSNDLSTTRVLSNNSQSARASDTISISASGYETKKVAVMSPKCGEITLVAKGSSITGMKFIAAKDSTYTAGVGGSDEPDAALHEVSFTYDYWMDSTEVTQSDFISVMSNDAFGYPSINYEQKWAVCIDTGVGDDYPAYNVTWYDCVMYCNVKSKIEGLDTVYSYSTISGKPGMQCTLQGVEINYEKDGYRLPTEAEWEYACRAGTTTDTYWGSENVDNYVWYLLNSSFTTNPVALKLPNNFGLYDMCGSVKEWCNDYYKAYKTTPLVDPVGPNSGLMDTRVVRGGSWASVNSSCTSGKRNFFFQNTAFSDRGFRVVKRVFTAE